MEVLLAVLICIIRTSSVFLMLSDILLIFFSSVCLLSLLLMFEAAVCVIIKNFVSNNIIDHIALSYH